MNGFLAKLLANHPFANVTFAVVLLVGFLAYADLPRERDPEINFNWVNVVTVMPGASAEDVEKRITKPLEDALGTVADIKFIASNSREDVSSILVRFREISELTYDKRVNDLRREIQNKASDELPEEAEDPNILEITTSNGFPTAMVLVTGAANDEALRRAALGMKEDIGRMDGVDDVFASGLNDPELHIDVDPFQLQARALTAVDVADAVRAWFRDTAAGGARVGDEEWLVRLLGTDSDPGHLADLFVSPAADPTAKIPLDSVAQVERGRESRPSWSAMKAVPPSCCRSPKKVTPTRST